jgi:hypothetical protein
MAEFIRVVLTYYDKMYRKGLDGRDAGKIVAVPTGNTDADENARLLMKAARGADAQGAADGRATDAQGADARPGGIMV